ncbi:MAG TPA: TIM-barrel domain-containing protein, partial [Ktedonobacterales bacterium]
MWYTPIERVSLEGHDERAWRLIAGDGTHAEIAALTPDIARVRIQPPGISPQRSWTTAHEDWSATPAPTVELSEQAITITTEAMGITIGLDPFSLHFTWRNGAPFFETAGLGRITTEDAGESADHTRPVGSVWCSARLSPGEKLFGGGERTTPLSLRGHRILFANVDPPQPHGADTGPMYASIPFWLGRRETRGYGLFIDSAWRGELDAGVSDPERMTFGVTGGELVFYVFAGPLPFQVLSQNAEVTGAMPLPPRWALGYGQSRWSYDSDAYVREIAKGFRDRRIPCDHLWLDIDYMDGYRDFTWNPTGFPDPAGLMRDLSAEGFKVVTIVDPGVKEDPENPTYAEGLAKDYFVRDAAGGPFVGIVWPGESVFPDFSREEVRAWWGERHRALLDAGVAGIWCDMNEPALTNRFLPSADVPHGTTMPDSAVHHPDGLGGQPMAHRAFHNAYGAQMARATREGLERLRPDARPFVLSRSGAAGVQQWATLWTGDNRSEWAHVRLAARMCLTLSMSGVPFVGFDSGGFWGDADGELLVRFIQLGSVFPFFRNHSAIQTAPQEPWSRGQPYEDMIRAAIGRRYQLLPYWYTLFAKASTQGVPIAVPLAYGNPHQPDLWEIEDEFLLGDVLVAPCMDQGMTSREVRFPSGTWVGWETGERISGPVTRTVAAPLDTLPMFAREGSIIPLGPVMQYVGELAEEPLTLRCFPNDDIEGRAEGSLYEDDGISTAYQRGEARWSQLRAERHAQSIVFSAQTRGAYDPGPRETTIELWLPPAWLSADAALTATRDGQPVEGMTVARRQHDTVIRIRLGRVSGGYTVEAR